MASLGIVTLLLAVPSGVTTILVPFDLVRADAFAFLGLNVLYREKLVPGTAFNQITKRQELLLDDGKLVYLGKWSIPLVRSHSRHAYLLLTEKNHVHFTRTQLLNLHPQFFIRLRISYSSSWERLDQSMPLLKRCKY